MLYMAVISFYKLAWYPWLLHTFHQDWPSHNCHKIFCSFSRLLAVLKAILATHKPKHTFPYFYIPINPTTCLELHKSLSNEWQTKNQNQHLAALLNCYILCPNVSNNKWRVILIWSSRPYECPLENITIFQIPKTIQTLQNTCCDIVTGPVIFTYCLLLNLHIYINVCILFI